MSDILFYGQFVAAKVGATGLTVTIDVRKVERATGTATTVVTGASATEWWKGIYRYRLTGADLQTYDYVGVFITSDVTVDQQEVPALWSRFSEAVATDASGRVDVGSILGTASAGVAGYVGLDWSHINAPTTTVGLSGTTVGTITTYTGNTVQTGDAFARIGAAGVSLTALGDTRLANLDAAVSTRSTYAGADTAGTTTLLARLTANRATGLDALDAAVSTRLAATDYTAPPATVTLATLQPNYAPAKAGDAMTLTLGQVGLTPRNLGTVADSALTVGDALVAAIAAATGQEAVVGTAYTVKTPSTGTVIRVLTLDDADNPTSRT